MALTSDGLSHLSLVLWMQLAAVVNKHCICQIYKFKDMVHSQI